MNYPYPGEYEYAEAYRQAERQVRARVKFFWHLAIFLVVNSFLFSIYLVNSLTLNWFGYPWFLWPLGVWGFFLVLRFLRVFVFPDSPARRQEMIARELERMAYPTYPPYPTSPTSVNYSVQPPLTASNNHNREEAVAVKGNQPQA